MLSGLLLFAGVVFRVVDSVMTELLEELYVHPASAWKSDLGRSTRRAVSKMSNFGDVQFTTNISVGGQILSAVVDSGSFDIIAFSAQCGDACGPTGSLYDEKKSKTFRAGTLMSKLAFGSGNLQTQASWETVTVENNIRAKDQLFWKTTNSDMLITQEGQFQAIVGVGPPESAKIMAEWELEEASRWLARRTQKAKTALGFAAPSKKMPASSGFFRLRNRAFRRVRPSRHRRLQAFPIFNENLSGSDAVTYYKNLVKQATTEKSFVERSGVRSMSICLHRESGSDGIFVWNDHEPESYPAGTFQSIKTVGDLYWSAQLQDARIGGAVIACHAGAQCSGILDTGTSLLSVPRSVGKYVEKLVRGLESCDDILSLPNLEFTLGGALISLPPESYVGLMDDDELEIGSQRSEGSNCRSLLLLSDSVGPMGEEWIIGLPFFRKYYTTFRFNEYWQPESMHFSEADSNCMPAVSKVSKTLSSLPVAKLPKKLSSLSVEVKSRKANILNVSTEYILWQGRPVSRQR